LVALTHRGGRGALARRIQARVLRAPRTATRSHPIRHGAAPSFR
jgi:hypothetical protein